MTFTFTLIIAGLQRHVCCSWRVLVSAASLPDDHLGVLSRAQPQEQRCFVIAGTKGLGEPRSPSGQPDPPSVTGPQLSPAPWARTRGWNPRNWDVWLRFSPGNGRSWRTSGIWKRNEFRLLLISYYCCSKDTLITRASMLFQTKNKASFKCGGAQTKANAKIINLLMACIYEWNQYWKVYHYY